ncbi:MAG TPA: metallopeptidase family protein [Acetobacteraceae bacterium]|nr:metallopeptidase family protein [Acetobacteraceae bacterium]
MSQHVRGVGITVEDMPDDETLEDLGIESGWELTGLYRGTPLTERSVSDTMREPDLIFLYRQPILLEWVETDVDLYHLVRNVLVHEIAHHFGFSDAAIEALEREME